MNDWTKPTPTTAADRVFGGSMDALLPPMKDIPEDFRRDRGEARKWRQFQRDWFYSGLRDFKPTMREGVDRAVAVAHLGAINASWEPKHEHKEAAVAWLASLWFADVSYTKGKP